MEVGLPSQSGVAMPKSHGQVVLRRSDSVTERTAGMFKTDKQPLTAEELRTVAADAIAESVQERMGG
jgi:hypothetical protein